METNKTLKLVIENYEREVIVTLEKFCNKHFLEFENWVDNKFGCIANFNNEYYISYQDIVWDILSNQPKDYIIKWLFFCSENKDKEINYYNFTLCKSKNTISNIINQ
jgi:hypothetical protein